MANWYGAARSNYIKIEDMDGLKKALEPFPIDICEEKDSMVCLLSDSDDGWPSWAYLDGVDGGEDQEIEFSPEVQICPFMAAGEILVMMQTGAEKLRYLSGHADAYNKAGKVITVSINDIYAKAAYEFGVKESEISRCEY